MDGAVAKNVNVNFKESRPVHEIGKELAIVIHHL